MLFDTLLTKVFLKVPGTHTICFTISFYTVNQMPITSRTNFHCEPTMSAKYLCIM